MHFKVVFRAAKALQSAGLAVLRFNFRGVGRSEGVHDHGSGEQEDARAALLEMQDRFPGLPLVLGGFSFGSPWPCASPRATRGSAPSSPSAIPPPAPPITRRSRRSAAAPLRPGRERRVRPGEALRALVEPLPPPREIVVIPGADHFFDGPPRRAAGRDRRLGGSPPGTPWLLSRGPPHLPAENQSRQAEGRGRGSSGSSWSAEPDPPPCGRKRTSPHARSAAIACGSSSSAAPEPPRHAEGVGREDRRGVAPEDGALLPGERGAEERQREVRAERGGREVERAELEERRRHESLHEGEGEAAPLVEVGEAGPGEERRERRACRSGRAVPASAAPSRRTRP